MRIWVGLAGAGLAMLAGVAAAADPPAQYKPEDVVKAYTSAAPASCAPGTVADPDGGCDPAVGVTRGFSLAAPTRTAGQPTTAKPAGAGAPHRAAVYKASAPLMARARPGDLLITFKLGSAELTPQARANAHAFATALKTPELADARFAIGGHTDATGSPARNQALSQTRAEAVKSFLVADGVDGSRLEAKGYGSERLADPEHPQSPANRRVEGLRLN